MAKKALITGASEGIGRCFALALAKQGYAVTAVARSQSKLDALLGELGPGHASLSADLSSAEGIAQVAERIRAEKFDLVVNNAGMGQYGPFHEGDLGKLQQMMRVNMDAVVALSHAFLTGAKSGDALMNVSSSLAFMAFPGSGTYAATKAFVTSLSESLWYENKDRGVYVLGVCPGATSTGFHTASGGTDANRPPENIMMPPEAVVAEALEALQARKSPTLVTGGKNRAMIFSTRLMSRKSVVNLMGNMASKRRSDASA